MPRCPRCAEDPCRCTAAATKPDDGGPAFPTAPEPFWIAEGSMRRASDYGMGGAAGMSLRQHYAGLAMQALLTGRQVRGRFVRHEADQVAEDSRVMADAMIAELKRGRG